MRGMETESGSNRHKVKRQRSNKRPKSPPGGNKHNAPLTFATQAEDDSFLQNLQPCVGSDRKEPTENTWQAQGALVVCWSRPMYVHMCQRAVLSDSSSESLFSVTECRCTCSRGLRRSVDPSSTWMEGTSKWTRSVDILSPGDMPSSTECSADCGLEAERFTVGG